MMDEMMLEKTARGNDRSEKSEMAGKILSEVNGSFEVSEYAAKVANATMKGVEAQKKPEMA